METTTPSPLGAAVVSLKEQVQALTAQVANLTRSVEAMLACSDEDSHGEAPDEVICFRHRQQARRALRGLE